MRMVRHMRMVPRHRTLSSRQFQEAPSRRKGRGPSRSSSLMPKQNEFHHIVIKDGKLADGQLGKMHRFFGTDFCAQDHFKLYMLWKEQSEGTYDAFLRDMKRWYRFHIGDTNGDDATDQDVKAALQPHVQKLIRDNRNYYKKKFFEGKTDAELVMCPISTMDPDEWQLLLDYWKREDVCRMTVANTVNRTKQKSLHTLGSKSLRQHYNEQMEVQQEGFSMVTAYVQAHWKADGTFPDGGTRERVEAVQRIAEASDLTASQDPADLASMLDEAFEGHHGGYERGLGFGYNRKKGFFKGNSSQSAKLKQMEERLHASEAGHNALTEKIRRLHEQEAERQREKAKEEAERQEMRRSIAMLQQLVMGKSGMFPTSSINSSDETRDVDEDTHPSHT